ncbi:MAG: hypothetical protein GY753_10960 [Gammaproteobacteria bacterium]|nr:hypothetical protein [Gammaproteobacteria bacterium]
MDTIAQITAVIVLSVMFYIYWRLIVGPVKTHAWKSFWAIMIMAFFATLVSGFVYLITSLVTAEHVNAGVIMAMIAGLSCILVLFQAIKR